MMAIKPLRRLCNRKLIQMTADVRNLRTGSRDYTGGGIGSGGPEWEFSSDYILMDQVDKYVDKPVHVSHPKSLIALKFLTNIDSVVSMNNNTLPSMMANFWPEKYLYRIDHDLLQQLSSDYRQWDLAKCRLSPKHMNWSAGLARCFSYFDGISFERLVFAHRHTTITFFIDDVWERSCFNRTSSTFGRAYMSNLSNIVRGEFEYLIDLRIFKSDQVTEELIHAARFAQDVLRQNLELGKKVLTSMGYALQCDVILIWFEHLIREETLFHSTTNNRYLFSSEHLMNTRVMTVGFELVLPAVLPVKDELGCEIIRPYNNFVMMGSMVAALDNDIASSPKEQGKKPGHESPMNLLFAVMKEDLSEPLTATRKVAHWRNSVVKTMADELEVCPKRWVPALTNILMYTLNFSDYEYVSEHGRPNTRYGFTWHTD